MYLDKDKILTSITKNDIIKLCSFFNCTDYKDFGNSLGFNTALCHKGDSPYKLVFYSPKDDQNYWSVHCFTCGDTYDLVQFVIRANRNRGITTTWYKALALIGQITGYLIEKEPEEKNKSDLVDLSWMKKIYDAMNQKTKAIPNLMPVNENVLECFNYDPKLLEGWTREGITPETLGRFEIGFYPLTNQITIPHRSWNTGELIGVRGRHVLPEDVEAHGKYIPMYISGKVLKHNLGSNIYGLSVIKDKVKECGKIMLVEGEKSVLQAYSYFGTDSFVAATCGSNITQTQIKIMLKELRVSEVMLAYDREYRDPKSWEATLYLQKLVKKILPLVPYCRVYLVVDTGDKLLYKDSPTDRGKDVLIELMKNKILITMDVAKEILNSGG